MPVPVVAEIELANADVVPPAKLCSSCPSRWVASALHRYKLKGLADQADGEQADWQDLSDHASVQFDRTYVPFAMET